MTPAGAARVLRDLAPPPGFRAAPSCATGCRLPAASWTGTAEWRGPRLGGVGPHAFVLVGVLLVDDPGAARDLVEGVARRSPPGPVREAVHRDADGYDPGRRGRCVVRTSRVGAWEGVVSVSRVDLLRPRGRPVRDVVQVDATLHRGTVAVQVIGWLDGSGVDGPDPAVRLDALTRQVARALDRARRPTA